MNIKEILNDSLLKEIEAFYISEHILTVKIPYNKLAFNKDWESSDTEKDTENDTENSTENKLEDKIIHLICNNSSLSTTKMASELGVSRVTIARVIKSSKRIVRIGPDKGGHWAIK